MTADCALACARVRHAIEYGEAPDVADLFTCDELALGEWSVAVGAGMVPSRFVEPPPDVDRRHDGKRNED